MLIKLDNGKYINTDYVEYVENSFVGFSSGRSMIVDETVHNRILQAMNGQQTIQLPKPSVSDNIAKIPEEYSDWLKNIDAEGHLNLFGVFELVRQSNYPISSWVRKNAELFAHAWIDKSWIVQETGEIVDLRDVNL